MKGFLNALKQTQKKFQIFFCLTNIRFISFQLHMNFFFIVLFLRIWQNIVGYLQFFGLELKIWFRNENQCLARTIETSVRTATRAKRRTKPHQRSRERTQSKNVETENQRWNQEKKWAGKQNSSAHLRAHWGAVIKAPDLFYKYLTNLKIFFRRF